MSNLPPDITDDMCEGYNPTCQNCGCYNDAHYIEDKEYEGMDDLCERTKDIGYMCIEYNSDGKVIHACDSLILGKQCDCKGFEE